MKALSTEDATNMAWYRTLSVVSIAAAGAGAPAAAQATLDAPPNLSHSWVAVAGGFQFNLLHRFSLGPAPSRRLQNAPTISLAYGVTSWLTAGLNYASASEVIQAYPNEWEFHTRLAPFTQDGGAPADLFLQVGYNVATRSVDGQLLLARRLGPVRAVAGVGVLEDALRTGRSRVTVAGGATVRIHGLLGLAADISTFADRDPSDEVAWSAGINVGVSHTPHTMSIHATNVASRTLQGIARGTGRTRYGFEYTIPISLSRFHMRTAPDRATAARRVVALPAHDTPRAAKPVTVDLRSLRYSKGKVEVDVGTTIVWRNRDPLVHSVTSDSGSFDSGELKPEASWSHTFTEPGTFSYHCTPHPLMRAIVVVRPIP
jgi:plastocyanin